MRIVIVDYATGERYMMDTDRSTAKRILHWSNYGTAPTEMDLVKQLNLLQSDEDRLTVEHIGSQLSNQPGVVAAYVARLDLQEHKHKKALIELLKRSVMDRRDWETTFRGVKEMMERQERRLDTTRKTEMSFYERFSALEVRAQNLENAIGDVAKNLQVLAERNPLPVPKKKKRPSRSTGRHHTTIRVQK